MIKKLFKHSPRTFIICILLTIMLPTLGLITFNVIIDPFGMFRIVAIENINKNKPYVAHYLRLSKAYLPLRYRPSAAIFGTSRAELGMNPEHPGFKANQYTAINMGMAGCGLYEIEQYLKHTYYSSGKNLKLAIIGLDFLMFNINRERVVFGTEVLDYDPKRLITTPNNFKALANDIDEIFLFKALRYSFNTIKEQDDLRFLYYPTGMRIIYLPDDPGDAKYENNDFNTEQYYIEKIWTAGPEKRYCTYCQITNTSTFETFKEIITFARDNNIKLKFFFSPTHARLLIAMREAGLWNAMTDVKRELVDILAADAAQYADQEPYPLWDFMYFNDITTEIMDRPTKMQWHLESSHYKTATGDQVLNKLLNYNADQHHDFGIMLTKSNIEQHLQQMLSDSLEFNEKFPNDVMKIRTIADNILKDRHGTYCTAAFSEYKRGILALQAANKADANKHFNIATKLHAQEKRLQKNGIPFRENGLGMLIAKGLEGHIVEPE